MNDFDVLLVDDEVEFLETLMKRIRKRGVRVSGVKSGDEALAFLTNTPVDVVVLDVKMPGMDGIETLRTIKKRHPLVEVIMLTGHATVESAVDGLKSGAIDFLMKPIGVDELIEKASDAFEKRQRMEEKIRMAQARRFMRSPREILWEVESTE